MINPRAKRSASYATGLLVVGSLAGMIWTWWPGAFTQITSENYLPHGYCYLWNKQLLTLHVVSDSIIFVSYLAIASTLALLLHRARRQLPFSWIVVAFGVFILSCGFTHAMDVVVLWRPLYWLAGDIKLVTAAASLMTAIALPFLVPGVQGMVVEAQASQARQAQLQSLNAELERQSADSRRKQQEEALRKREALLEAAERLTDTGGWELDLVTTELFWSAEVYRIFGVAHDYRPVFEEVSQFYVPEERITIRAAIETAIAGGVKWDMECTILRAEDQRSERGA